MKNYELMGLQTASGAPILSPMVAMMCEAYLDYLNNYLSIDAWAEAYVVDSSLYDVCRSVYFAEHPNY